jgi:hypothetical protein
VVKASPGQAVEHPLPPSAGVRKDDHIDRGGGIGDVIVAANPVEHHVPSLGGIVRHGRGSRQKKIEATLAPQRSDHCGGVHHGFEAGARMQALEFAEHLGEAGTRHLLR